MRAGALSTIQQTLTPEAANVLNHSIDEAARRNHGHTTPLHVAATLLSSPSGFLRQACVRSHPNSSHPLQSRALELCFSVALERLPAVVPTAEPQISNALMAALKRAQAHQRRGCPEQQQQPLLAVKVELEQLIISILDDPSVSRVMREASFSSPSVKSTIEESLNSQALISVSPIPTPNHSFYLNPLLQQQGKLKNDEVKRVTDIMLRNNKRNPILVGDTEPETVMKELLRRIRKGEMDEGAFKNVEVIPLQKEIKELGGLIRSRMANSCNGGGIIVDLGDLKWLVEQPIVSGTGRAAVVEMGKLLADHAGSSSNCRLWLIGTATCETYLRCQVYHPSMENDWDLQALPVASKLPLPGMFPRLGANVSHRSSIETLSPLKSFPTAATTLPRPVENLDPAQRMSCCSQCTENYEKELSKLTEKSSSIVESEATQSPLPLWLQNAKAQSGNVNKTTDQSKSKDEEMIFRQKSEAIHKKWRNTCVHLHPNFHHNLRTERITPKPLSMTGLLGRTFPPKLQQTKMGGETLQLRHMGSPPRSPVRTDLVLGQGKISETTPEKIQKEVYVKDSKSEKFANSLDADAFKKLLNGLTEKVWWQQEAASAVATTLSRCRVGNGKRRGDIWLLFTGPDRVGKKKMASVLSEQASGANPTTICVGSQQDRDGSQVNIRGKTVLDRIVEAVRKNPFCVVMLEDIDEADMLVRGSIKRAMERGKLVDSHGREISLGNVIFILTANDLKMSSEKKLNTIASGGLRLRLSIGEKSVKRRADWLCDQSRAIRARKDNTGSSLSFDLNELAGFEDNDRTDGSQNSSDLTVDHEDELDFERGGFSITSVPRELVTCLDGAIVFKPVNMGTMRRKIKTIITEKFDSVLDGKVSVEVHDDTLAKIIGSVWVGPASVDDWAEEVLVPSFHRLKSRLPACENAVVRLESNGDWQPNEITVVVGV